VQVHPNVVGARPCTAIIFGTFKNQNDQTIIPAHVFGLSNGDYNVSGSLPQAGTYVLEVCALSKIGYVRNQLIVSITHSSCKLTQHARWYSCGRDSCLISYALTKPADDAMRH
jgi:hypothetical protein